MKLIAKSVLAAAVLSAAAAQAATVAPQFGYTPYAPVMTQEQMQAQMDQQMKAAEAQRAAIEKHMETLRTRMEAQMKALGAQIPAAPKFEAPKFDAKPMIATERADLEAIAKQMDEQMAATKAQIEAQKAEMDKIIAASKAEADKRMEAAKAEMEALKAEAEKRMEAAKAGNFEAPKFDMPELPAHDVYGRQIQAQMQRQIEAAQARAEQMQAWMEQQSKAFETTEVKLGETAMTAEQEKWMKAVRAQADATRAALVKHQETLSAYYKELAEKQMKAMQAYAK
ncbi:MAG: hypothetical protein ACPGU7_05830 [Gammaproteobacteria bacterium]